jgi:hypothetical protein
MNAKLIAVAIASLIAAPVALADINTEGLGPTTNLQLWETTMSEVQEDQGSDPYAQIQEPEADIFDSVQNAYDAIDDAGGFIGPDADVDADTD